MALIRVNAVDSSAVCNEIVSAKPLAGLSRNFRIINSEAAWDVQRLHLDVYDGAYVSSAAKAPRNNLASENRGPLPRMRGQPICPFTEVLWLKSLSILTWRFDSGESLWLFLWNERRDVGCAQHFQKLIPIRLRGNDVAG